MWRQNDLPIFDVSRPNAAAIASALSSLKVDDASLTDIGYQSVILAEAYKAAGAALRELAAEARERLQVAPWCVVLRGLPAERATQILVTISATLGRLVEPYRQPWSQVVRHIVPSHDRAVDGRVLNEFLHTDGTDWVQPNDYTCLFCVRPDRLGGGESRLLDVDTLFNELARGAHAKLMDRLADRPIPWRIAEELGGGVHWAPAIQLAPRRIRWLRFTAMLSCQDGLASLESDVADDLQEFERLIEHCPGLFRTNLESGDLLLIDNARCLHARTPIVAARDSSRELRRTKIMITEAPQ